MTQQYSNENRGVLFKNDRKQAQTHADYQGTVNVNGQEFYLNAWIKQGAKGKFFSLSVKPKPAGQGAEPKQHKMPPKSSAGFDDLDTDSVPF